MDLHVSVKLLDFLQAWHHYHNHYHYGACHRQVFYIKLLPDQIFCEILNFFTGTSQEEKSLPKTLLRVQIIMEVPNMAKSNNTAFLATYLGGGRGGQQLSLINFLSFSSVLCRGVLP